MSQKMFFCQIDLLSLVFCYILVSGFQITTLRHGLFQLALDTNSTVTLVSQLLPFGMAIHIL